jgi:hypothetical protein
VQWADYESFQQLRVQDGSAVYLVSRPKDDPSGGVRKLLTNLVSQRGLDLVHNAFLLSFVFVEL